MSSTQSTTATDAPDAGDPHLFLAKNAQGHDALWWGTGPDDRRCQELDLSSLRRGNRDAEKAVWEAVMGSYMVEDCTDWEPGDPYDKPVRIQGHMHSEPICAWPDCRTYLTRDEMAAKQASA